MATIIAFTNQKGGVAKTTSTYNIGMALAQKGKKTLLIDLDGQASLTISVGKEPYKIDNTIASALKDPTSDIRNCIQNIKPNLDIITSRIELAKVEAELINRTARESTLKRVLEPIQDSYDFILIDCPPQLSMLTINGLGCADYAIIPVKTDYLAYRGIDQLIETIDEVKRLINKNLKVMGVIATMYESRSTDDKDILEYLKKGYKVLGVIKKTVQAKKGIYDGESVVERLPDSDIAVEYSKIADYIIGGVN